MKARINSSLILLAVGMIIGVVGWAQERPKQTALPVPAVAKLCGNVTVTAERKAAAFQVIQAEGCEDIRFVHIGDGRWLCYGTRVLIGEADEK